MSSYAQTNLQLFNQLRGLGYGKADLALIRDAYELAMVLFSGRFQSSGKSFIAHVVGTASVAAALRSPGDTVAAALLHSAYAKGDFGHARGGVSRRKRREISGFLGAEVEEYLARFPHAHWRSPTVRLACTNPSRLGPIERNLLILRLADYRERLLDSDLLYYGDTARRFFLSSAGTAVATAENLGLLGLATEIKQAVRNSACEKMAVDPAPENGKQSSFTITPKSCRVHLSIRMRRGLGAAVFRLRRKALRGAKVLYDRSANIGDSVRQGKTTGAGGYLAPRSPEFKKLFPAGSVPERVATGFRFTEGPVWIVEKKSLLFSDIPASRIYQLAVDGEITVMRDPSGNSNGLTRDKQGRLIACEHGNRRVTRTEHDGSVATLVETFQGRKLNSPNDVVVKSDGSVYFTDPGCGIEPCEQEQPMEGVYRLSPDGQALSLVAGDFARPNGLALSPDEKKLYIDDSQRRHIRVFEVREDGSLVGGSVFHDMNVRASGSPDGMKVDIEGRVYCTGAGGVWVLDPAGNHLGTIALPERPSNCAWGGDDWRTLYITAVSSIYRIHLNTAGIRV
jgi:gluconolactonase